MTVYEDPEPGLKFRRSGVLWASDFPTSRVLYRSMDLAPAVAYLSDGKLYLKEPAKPPRLVESAFAQGLADRAARGRQRNDWKAKGAWWNLNPTRMIADAEMPAEVR